MLSPSATAGPCPDIQIPARDSRIDPLPFGVVQKTSTLLGAFGFEPVFVAHDRGNLVVLARLARGHESLTPMSEAAVADRLAKYSVARDMAILRVPERRRPGFADEWPKIVERAFLAGRIEMGSDGKPRVKRAAEAPAED